MSDTVTLAASYARCREVMRRHGRSYYLAARLLPADRRRHVHALYAFTRHADDLVDVAGTPADLRAWAAAFTARRAGAHPLLPAVFDTVDRCGQDPADFTAFLASMAMDLQVTAYPTYADLLGYMEGSAAVIGTMMLPVLDPPDPAAVREPARQLGLAFQLTNFIRDVGEDLDRGRLYLPLADLDRYGVTRADLAAAHRAGGLPAAPAGERIRALIAAEVDRAREHYAAAEPGIQGLRGASRTCIRAARRLYGGILEEVVARRYDVFAGRAVVPRRRRLAAVLATVLSAGAPPRPAGRRVGRGAPGAAGTPASGGRPDAA
ncbi:phytoene synthase [Pilimelia terevasa]|uniref:Phytoene synthase n=1 Tax=Pilimelia terevasa TaxID=53372 RepID=A0A8J3BCZ0_9ACTN|nr:phytoene/squalene synthase family protein [Pilimelia terevasa]GGK12421.1 phytoene synthase [Pilimelia terevasa]